MQAEVRRVQRGSVRDEASMRPHELETMQRRLQQQQGQQQQGQQQQQQQQQQQSRANAKSKSKGFFASAREAAFMSS